MKNITKFNTLITIIYLLILSTTVHASFRNEDDRQAMSRSIPNQAHENTFHLMPFDEIEEVFEEEKSAERRSTNITDSRRRNATINHRRRKRNSTFLSIARNEQVDGNRRLLTALLLPSGPKRNSTLLLIANDRNIDIDIRLLAAEKLPYGDRRFKILRKLRRLIRKSVDEYDSVAASASKPTRTRARKTRICADTLCVHVQTSTNQQRYKEQVALALNTSLSNRRRVLAALDLPRDHPMREGVLFQLVIEGLGADIRSALILPDDEFRNLMLLQIALNRSQNLPSLDMDVGYNDLDGNVDTYVLNQLKKTFSNYARIIAARALSEDYRWHAGLLRKFGQANIIDDDGSLPEINSWRTMLLKKFAYDENINIEFRIIAAEALPIGDYRLYGFVGIIDDIKKKTDGAENLIKAKHAVVDTVIGFSEDNIEREEMLDRITKNSSFGTYRFKAAMAFPTGNVHRITGLRYLAEDPKLDVDDNIKAALLLRAEGMKCTQLLKKLAENPDASEILRVRAAIAMPKRKGRSRILRQFAQNSDLDTGPRIMATIASSSRYYEDRNKSLLRFAKKRKRSLFSFHRPRDIDINYRVMSTIALPKRHPKRPQLLLEFVDLIIAGNTTINEENCIKILSASADMISDFHMDDENRTQLLLDFSKDVNISDECRFHAANALPRESNERIEAFSSMVQDREFSEKFKNKARRALPNLSQ